MKLLETGLATFDTRSDVLDGELGQRVQQQYQLAVDGAGIGADPAEALAAAGYARQTAVDHTDIITPAYVLRVFSTPAQAGGGRAYEVYQRWSDDITDMLRPTLNPGEQVASSPAPWYRCNGNPQLLQAHGLLELAAAAFAQRVATAARAMVQHWAGTQQRLDSVAAKVLFFGFLHEKRHESDVYGQAAAYLVADPQLLARTKQAYEANLRRWFLTAELTEEEVAKNSSATEPNHGLGPQPRRASKYVDLVISRNTIELFEELLQHLGIWEQAWQAYAGRYEKALRLNPANDEALIQNTLRGVIPPMTAAEKLRVVILQTVRATEGAVPVAQVRQLRQVLSDEVLKSKQGSQMGHELRQVRGLVGEQEHIWYVVSIWYAGGDDGDAWCYVFEHQQDAAEEFDYFTNPDAKQSNLLESLVLYDAVFTMPDGGKKMVHDVVLHEGKLCRPKVTGVGRRARLRYQLLLCSAKLAPAALARARSLDGDWNYEAIWADKELRAGGFVEGDNGHGWHAELERGAYLTKYHCWETGINYYALTSRLPQEVFSALQREAGLFYHDQEIEEEGAWTAWCTTDLEAAAQVLARHGWQLHADEKRGSY